MMKYFTLKELTHSARAEREGISNQPDEDQIENLTALVENILDPLREACGRPIYVSSGFRSVRVNRMVGGKANSQHLKGEAADISVGTKSGNEELFKLCQELNLPWDQLIDESGFSWLHISYKKRGRNRKQILHL